MGGLITPPALGGWTRTQLVELADRRTERRGSKTLDLDSEYLMALQEFCMETRWAWRRKIGMFTTVAGTWQYDLTDPVGADAIDLHQFAKHGVKYYPDASQPQVYGEITPLFERNAQTAAIYANRFASIPAPPRQYFMHPGAFLVLDLTPAPDRAYPITIDYWSVPNVDPTTIEDDDTIPLLPAFMHHVLLKKLECQIFRYTLGEGDAKYKAAMGEYHNLVDSYQGMDGMVSGEHSDYSEDDDYESTFANAQNAVQSTS